MLNTSLFSPHIMRNRKKPVVAAKYLSFSKTCNKRIISIIDPGKGAIESTTLVG
jgi:hypothetical protein